MDHFRLPAGAGIAGRRKEAAAAAPTGKNVQNRSLFHQQPEPTRAHHRHYRRPNKAVCLSVPFLRPLPFSAVAEDWPDPAVTVPLLPPLLVTVPPFDAFGPAPDTDECCCCSLRCPNAECFSLPLLLLLLDRIETVAADDPDEAGDDVRPAGDRTETRFLFTKRDGLPGNLDLPMVVELVGCGLEDGCGCVRAPTCCTFLSAATTAGGGPWGCRAAAMCGRKLH
uniref:Uncharacterized protein n=1 Tax=Anopheles merus TaxID=30066 RepID=A0A182UPF8_ANOME